MNNRKDLAKCLKNLDCLNWTEQSLNEMQLKLTSIAPSNWVKNRDNPSKSEEIQEFYDGY